MSWDVNKIIQGLQKSFDSHDAAAIAFVEPLAQMLMDNPDEAINRIFSTYNAALDAAYTNNIGNNVRSFIESVAGGPYQGVPWALYNSVGAVYPYLERPQKDRALKQVLNILDGLNYVDVNGGRGAGHTTRIKEPLLLSDINIARYNLYWPGLHDEEKLWKDQPDFSILQGEIMTSDGMFRRDKVKSDFLVAYALLRSDFYNHGEEYAKAANPNFLYRTLKGIVGMRFAHAENEEQVRSGMDRLRVLLPFNVHDQLEPIRLEADWVDHAKFR